MINVFPTALNRENESITTTLDLPAHRMLNTSKQHVCCWAQARRRSVRSKNNTTTQTHIKTDSQIMKINKNIIKMILVEKRSPRLALESKRLAPLRRPFAAHPSSLPRGCSVLPSRLWATLSTQQPRRLQYCCDHLDKVVQVYKRE